MKTRQEMIYDFMLALASNSYIYQEWSENLEDFGDLSDHVKSIASELTDTYLESLQ